MGTAYITKIEHLAIRNI